MQHRRLLPFFIWSIFSSSFHVFSVVIMKQPSGSGVCNFTCLSVQSTYKLSTFAACLGKGLVGNPEQGDKLETYSKSSCPTGSIPCLTSCHTCGSPNTTSQDQDGNTLFQQLRKGFQPSSGKSQYSCIYCGSYKMGNCRSETFYVLPSTL